MNRRWIAKVESLRRAGLDRIARARLASVRRVASDDHPPIAMAQTAEASPAPADKPAWLAVLRNEVAVCTKCSLLVQSRSRTVFSDGTPHAELCFVGEAPGFDEDQQGVPFVGRAGRLLTDIIHACKLKREEVYICNVLKCRPPDNRNPMPDEMENCRPFLERQLQIVQPKVLVALGKFAAAFLLEQPVERIFITKIRGQVREYRGIPVMLTLHPSYLLRNPAAKRDIWKDMIQVMRMLGRPID